MALALWAVCGLWLIGSAGARATPRSCRNTQPHGNSLPLARAPSIHCARKRPARYC